MPENGVDHRGGGIQIGRDDEHVGRRGRIVGRETAQKLVMQYLDFPRQRMRHMDFQTVIRSVCRLRSIFPFLQIQHGILNARQQGIVRIRPAGVHEIAVFRFQRVQLRHHQAKRGGTLFAP